MLRHRAAFVFVGRTAGHKGSMRSHRTWLTAITLLVLGIVSFALQPVLDPKPDSVCVKDGAPSSGFVDSDKDDCPISDASYAKIAD